VLITTDHARSSYGFPVILDDAGSVMDPAPGLAAVRRSLGLTQAQAGELVGASVRAVQHWEQGRRHVPATVLYVLGQMLDERRAAGDDEKSRPN